MNLHEYQAKLLFAEYGMPVLAQVHAGGRGKAGGVKLVSGKEALSDYVQKIIGHHLVTYQTDAKGQPVNSVLVETPCEIERELYVSAVVDRATKRLTIMASTEGGVDIEKVAEESPEKIFKLSIDPTVGLMPFQARALAFELELKNQQIQDFVLFMQGLVKFFVECDLSLLEINPLVVTKAEKLVCLDGKVIIDDNALFRHPKLEVLRDVTQEDARENHAREWELNYIPLEGNIGCMVNGAGLAMATMDVIKLHGGEPANFLDVGGGATKERVSEAFQIILSDNNVKGILVNIFGGIVRCDLIAEGILAAVKAVQVSVPVVVRLEGNNAALGSELLNSSGMNVIAAQGLTDAAQKIVAAIKH